MLEQPDSRPVRLANGKEGYRLCQPYVYIWWKDQVIRRIKIPEGFEYDGASVPRLAWTLTGIERDGLQRAAALVHDMLYQHRGKLPDGVYQRLEHVIDPVVGSCDAFVNVSEPWTRAAADRMFCRLLREAGVSQRRRRLMYFAVRACGWIFWPEGTWKELGRWLLSIAKRVLINRYFPRS